MIVTCSVNGETVLKDVPPRLLLSDFLRHHLHLTGTHIGCEMGACGACTVIVDGDAVRSCLMFAWQADGFAIKTVEGLEKNEELSPLQDAFHRHHALQCGYCTSGFLMTITAALLKGELPAKEEAMRKFLSGNICRCTGYQPIVEAVLEIAREAGTI